VIAASSSQLLWYTTRATGIVALALLTGVVVLGVLTALRRESSNVPRFAVQDLHRRFSLLAVVFTALHVLTTLTDAYVPVGWASLVVPFTSPYRRLWLGLGTVAVDLLLAVTVSSLARRAMAHRVWRAIHWSAYAAWPVALVHASGTGTDRGLRWTQVLAGACVAAVVTAGAVRVVVARAQTRGAHAGPTFHRPSTSPLSSRHHWSEP
jgi:methionine sulfoxide reductase heme-binding subunit